MPTDLQVLALLAFLVYQSQGYNILAHWSLNGTKQGLTLHGGPTFVEGRYPGSKAINFNQPSNCFARIPKVELRSRSFTIALWIKVKKEVDRVQAFFGDWYDPFQFVFSVSGSGRLVFKRHSIAHHWFGVKSNGCIDVYKWWHVAVTWDQSAGVVKLFLNANEVSSRQFDTSIIWEASRPKYEIGDDGHWTERQFLGSVMDLYIIEGVLNSEQLNNLRGFLEITTSYLNNTFVCTNETVRCQANGSPTPYVAWVRSGVVLVNKTSSAQITITEVNGEYVCVASNREGIMKVIVKATKEFLEITTSYLNNMIVYTNETVRCHAIACTPPFVAWVRSGVVLVNKTSAAEIIITEDNGEYVCIASNRIGIKKVIVKVKAPLQLCQDYHIISDVSRSVNHTYNSSQVNDYSKDIDLSKWYRLQSSAGNQLPTTCVPQNKCGAQAPGWLNGAHPSINDGVVQRTVCFHFNCDCCYQNATVQVRKCHGYYVYKFSGIPKELPGRYCIENKQHDNQDDPQSTFATSKDSHEVLVGHVMYSEAGVQKDLICLNYCILYSECKSFNFSKDKKICELNNATRREYPDAFMKNDTFAYYEKLNFNTITVN